MKEYGAMGRKLKPIYDHLDLDYTAQVKTVKDSFWVVFNRLRYRFVVMDRDAHNTPYVVMIVMEEDGSFRPFDERVLINLRKTHQRGPDVKKILGELETIEAERLRKNEKDSDELVYGFADMMKWMGKDVTPSTAWRDRGLEHEAKVRREQIRAAAR